MDFRISCNYSYENGLTFILTDDNGCQSAHRNCQDLCRSISQSVNQQFLSFSVDLFNINEFKDSFFTDSSGAVIDDVVAQGGSGG